MDRADEIAAERFNKVGYDREEIADALRQYAAEAVTAEREFKQLNSQIIEHSLAIGERLEKCEAAMRVIITSGCNCWICSRLRAAMEE